MGGGSEGAIGIGLEIALEELNGLVVLEMTVVNERFDVGVDGHTGLKEGFEGVRGGAGDRIVGDDLLEVALPAGGPGGALEGADSFEGERLIGIGIAFVVEALVPGEGGACGIGGFGALGDGEDDAGAEAFGHAFEGIVCGLLRLVDAAEGQEKIGHLGFGVCGSGARRVDVTLIGFDCLLAFAEAGQRLGQQEVDLGSGVAFVLQGEDLVVGGLVVVRFEVQAGEGDAGLSAPRRRCPGRRLPDTPMSLLRTDRCVRGWRRL